MPTKLELLQEANKRGLLSPDKATLYKEAVKRGLITADKPVDLPPEIPVPKTNVFAGAKRTLQDLGKVYPALEAAASFATSAYGIPASGLAGLAALPFGLEKAGEVTRGVQKLLVYEPQTEAGGELLEASAYPLQVLESMAEKAGSGIAEAGYPNIGATIKTGIIGAPIIAAGGKTLLKPTKARIKQQIFKEIDKGIEKGVKSSVAGRKTFTQGKVYRERAESAIRSIIDNKNELALTDVNGEVVRGQLPQNLKQFSQAIEQSRRKVFSEYDQVAKVAGEKGATVDLTPIVNELETISTHSVVGDLNPTVANYAEGLGKRLKKRGLYTAGEAQDAIATLNNNLEAFYKNPSYENASRAYVDSVLANNLRKTLDAVIEKTTIKEYQKLKNQYGALKTIEKDVYKRSLIDARKQQKGLIDFTDVFSGYHAIHGILRLDPAMVGAGAASKGIAWLYRLKNNPNRIVKNMFKKTEALITKERLK